MLKADHISLAFDKQILDKVSFSIDAGEIVGIIGSSGAGKTSLLHILAGLLDADTGNVVFAGEEVRGPSRNLVPGHPEIRVVNQNFSLDIFHTVEENVREEALHLPHKLRDKLVNELLVVVDLQAKKEQKAHTLSGGEQQRLSIARALAKEPAVLLLDEPFSHLDATLRLRLTDYLLKLRKVRATSLVIVSHDPQEVLSVADTLFFLKNGVLRRLGTAENAYYRYKTVAQARLLGPLNVIGSGKERIAFRPDEYRVSEQGRGIEVDFQYSLFTGKCMESYFRTSANELVVLYSLNPLDNVRFIEINKKG